MNLPVQLGLGNYHAKIKMKSETPRKTAPVTKASAKTPASKRDTGAGLTATPPPAEVAPVKRPKVKTETVAKATAVTPATAPVAKKVTAVKVTPVVKLPLAATKLAPTHDEIAKRAYEIYLGRGQSEGNAAQDWLQAERELLARQNN